ncbi:MAG: branched-chain amino acid ABC transporter substrate-binding protein [Chloroflexi bacterium]|nr:branched-chain amino acid ABC transporter substrate-binding protein [Chloroflexota bacterium]
MAYAPRIGTLFSIIVVALLALAGCTSSDSPSSHTATVPLGVSGGPNVIKIVSSMPRSGSDKGQTDSIVRGFVMALEEVNYRIGDLTLVYYDLDDGTPARGGAWDQAKEAENAHAAANDPDVVAYLGTFNSGAAKIAIPVLNRVKLAMVSPANTWPGLTKPGKGDPTEPDTYYPTGQRNYVRVVPADDLQGAVGAAFAQQLGVTKVYVLDDTELYGHGIATIFADTARKLGMAVVGGPEGIDRNAADYRALALKIRNSGADMVYFGGITANNAGKLWQDLRSVLGANVVLMGPDGMFDQAFVDAAGEAALGTYLTFGGVPPSKLTGKGKEFYTAYKEKYQAEPEVYAAYGYEAAKVVLDAITRVGRKDREAIRQAILDTKDFDGVLGRWSFDANGDTTLTTMSVSRITSNKIADAEFVGLIEAPR